MVTIPVRATPNQAFQCILGDQNCSIRLVTRYTVDLGNRLYIDLAVKEAQIMQGVLCQDGVMLPLYEYLGFEGGLVFIDLQGNDDPLYTGLGSRWQFVYLNKSEAADYLDGTLEV